MKEECAYLVLRWFWSQHFHLSLRGGVNDLEFAFDDSIFEGDYDPRASSLMSVRKFVYGVGVGHHYLFKNGLSFGVDWLTVLRPLKVIDSDFEAVKFAKFNMQNEMDAPYLLKYLKEDSLLGIIKMGIGYSF